MKKLALFLFGCFATSFSVIAQDISADMFTTPANTGANMTVGVNASKFDQFASDGQIGAFADLDGDGTLECVGLESIATGFFGLALWGDDSSTPIKDGLASGESPVFAILHGANVILVSEIPQFTGYITNGIVNIDDAELSGTSCDNPEACNFGSSDLSGYTDISISEASSCIMPVENCTECDGNDGLTLIDADDDGVCDKSDAFPNDPSEWLDSDNDGVGDNADAFAYDATETVDTDGDGTGDNADAFPNDASETEDTDGDGVGDNADDCPDDASETVDTDGDGVCDNSDAFPDDDTETADTDGDGVGDNADAFPNDASETKDSDGDGLGDNADIYAGCIDDSACNYNSSETLNEDNLVCSYASDLDDCATCSGETDGTGVVVDNDADDDAYCDLVDAFPNDSTEWLDSDNDGVGDNADAFPYDASETSDFDGDGVGDNADACPTDSTETVDTDGDGVCDGKEIFGCTNPAASNFDPLATESALDGELACVIEGINFTPLSDSENTSIVLTGSNMSLLFQPQDEGKFDTNSNILVGDILAAVYETDRLENEFLDYSVISGLANAGSAVWTGDQLGLAIFGADNQLNNNGFDTYEDLKFQVLRDGVAYHASVTYLTPGYDGRFEDGLYVAVSSVTVGAPTSEGCTDPTYMEYDPLATDSTSCSTFISVGCNDSQYVNYAGADLDANAIHDNAENFGDPFGQNYTIDLNSGSTSPSGTAATIHDITVCQTQVPGCTYPYASNYDSSATEDDGSCDWSSYALTTVHPVTGIVQSVDYNFGADSDDSNNEWIGSDFEYANDLYQGNAMGTGHVVTDLIAAYDFYTQQYKADSTAYAVNDSTWSADYDTLNNQWQRTYDDTLADVAEWFAADEAADAQELADSLADNYRRYFVNDSTWNAIYTDTLADVAEWFAADELADSLELDSTINYWTNKYNDTLADVAEWFAADELADSIAFAKMVEYKDSVIQVTTDSLNYHRAPIVIDLHTGWNTVGYYLQHSSPVVAQFEAQFGTGNGVANNINIVKNNEGLFYWPDFAFDGLVSLEPGQGYQVRVKDESSGKSDFVFTHGIDGGEYRILTPTVPAWALEMEVENHPNDIRSLVRVVNMLGQEVNPAEQFNGEVLLYLYNDGSVEKKMVK